MGIRQKKSEQLLIWQHIPKFEKKIKLKIRFSQLIAKTLLKQQNVTDIKHNLTRFFY